MLLGLEFWSFFAIGIRYNFSLKNRNMSELYFCNHGTNRLFTSFWQLVGSKEHISAFWVYKIIFLLSK